jgi:hypothetical protein
MRNTPSMLNRPRIRQFTWLILFSLMLLPGPTHASAGHSQAGDCIEAIGLCEVVDGRKRQTILTGDQLKTPLAVQGYVSEITLYCTHEDVSAKIQAEPSAVDERIKITKSTGEANWNRFPKKSHQVIIVPKIEGDCLSLDNVLSVAISSPRGEAFELKIHQTGYHQVYEAPEDCSPRSQPLVYRFLGKDGARFQTQAGQDRFKALTEGIRKIEQAYGQEFVESVNIIDLKGQNNALSLKGKDEIWLYADTFWGYGTGELRSMASHETLHIFVDRLDLTQKSTVRQLFADLMGFKPNSRERATLLNTGHLPRGYVARHNSHSPFWGFINERHFIDGMSGGHSSDNIDEFCTSFLHSLLYSEQLEKNLRKPVVLNGRRSPRVIKNEERDHLLHLYRQAVEVFHSAAMDSGGHESSPVIAVCTMTLEHIEQVDPLNK